MKKTIISLFVFLFLFVFSAIMPLNDASAADPAPTVAAAPTAGAKFSSAEGKFKIGFQGQPQMESQDVTTVVGDIKMHTFMEMKGATDAYMVSYNDYPAELISGADAKNIVDGAKNGVVNQFGAKIVEEKPLTLGGNTGVMCKANSSSMYVVYYAYLVKNRLYQIMILKNGGFPNQQEVDAFHGSFELIS